MFVPQVRSKVAESCVTSFVSHSENLSEALHKRKPQHYSCWGCACSLCAVRYAGRGLSLTKFRSSSGTKQLTSHSIVGEPLTELIHHNEEDAYWVTQQCLLLQGEKISALIRLPSISFLWQTSGIHFLCKCEQKSAMAYLQTLVSLSLCLWKVTYFQIN